MGIDLSKLTKQKIFNTISATRSDSSPIEGVSAMCTSRDMKLLVTSDDKEIVIWNSEKREILTRLQGHTEVITHICMNSSGTVIISCGADGTIRKWSQVSDSWSCDNFVMNVHSGWAWGSSWLQNIGAIASVGTDGQLILWDVGQPLVNSSMILGAYLHVKSATGVTVIITTTKLYLITVGHDSGIVINTLTVIETGEYELVFLKHISSHLGEINGIDSFSFSNLGGSIFVTIGEDFTTRIWSLSDALDSTTSSSTTVTHVTFTGDSPVACVKISPDGLLFATGDGEGTVTIFRSAIPGLNVEPRIQTRIFPKMGRITSIAWGKNIIFAGLESGKIVIVDVPKYISSLR